MYKFFLILFLMLPVLIEAQNHWNKIDPEVAVNSRTEMEFFVVMKDQAEVSSAKSIITKEEKAKYVYNKLTQTAEETQGPILRLLQNKKVTFRSFFIVNSIWVKGDYALAEELAAREDVAKIAPNPHIRNQLKMAEKSNGSTNQSNTIEWGIVKIKAIDLWAQNIKGSGVVIGGQDTGYDWLHPAINPQYKGTAGNHNYTWHDAIHRQISTDTFNSCGFNSKIPCDDGSHGTHTMGTMVGDDGIGNQIGVAPEATWIGCRNMENGWGTPATYIECFEWFLAPTDTNNLNPDPAKAPHVINNSWSCPVSEGCNNSNFSMMQTAIENLKASGVFIAVSAGNNGSQGCNSIDAPAAHFEASFTVGASNIMDTLANFSSRGNVDVDSSMRMKPNVTAPGVSVRSCVPGGGFASYSGTSMAGPHVAGAVALLIAARPDFAGNVDTLETLLEMTADTIYTYRNDTCGGTTHLVFPNNMTGYGRINLAKVLKIVRPELNVSVNQLEDLELTVFPVPAFEKLNILCSQNLGDCKLSVFSMLGQQIYSRSISFNGQYELGIEELSSGVYILRIESQGRILQKKFIRN